MRVRGRRATWYLCRFYCIRAVCASAFQPQDPVLAVVAGIVGPQGSIPLQYYVPHRDTAVPAHWRSCTITFWSPAPEGVASCEGRRYTLFAVCEQAQICAAAESFGHLLARVAFHTNRRPRRRYRGPALSQVQSFAALAALNFPLDPPLPEAEARMLLRRVFAGMSGQVWGVVRSVEVIPRSVYVTGCHRHQRLATFRREVALEEGVVAKLQERFNTVSHLVMYVAGGIQRATQLNRLLFYEHSAERDDSQHDRRHLLRVSGHGVERVRAPHLLNVNSSWAGLHAEALAAGIEFGSLHCDDKFMIDDACVEVAKALEAEADCSPEDLAEDAAVPLVMLLWTDGTTVQKHQLTTCRFRLIDPTRCVFSGSGCSQVHSFWDTWSSEHALPDDLLICRSRALKALLKTAFWDHRVWVEYVMVLADHAMLALEVGMTLSSQTWFCPMCPRRVKATTTELTPITDDRFDLLDHERLSRVFISKCAHYLETSRDMAVVTRLARGDMRYAKTGMPLFCSGRPGLPLGRFQLAPPVFHSVVSTNWAALDLLVSLLRPRRGVPMDDVKEALWTRVREVTGICSTRGYFDGKMLRVTISWMPVIAPDFIHPCFIVLTILLSFINNVVWSSRPMPRSALATFAVYMYVYILTSEVVYRHTGGKRERRRPTLHHSIYSHELLHHVVPFIVHISETLGVGPLYLHEELFEGLWHELKDIVTEYTDRKTTLENLRKIRTGRFARQMVAQLTGVGLRQSIAPMLNPGIHNLRLWSCLFSGLLHDSALTYCVPFWDLVQEHMRAKFPEILIGRDDIGGYRVLCLPGAAWMDVCICGAHVVDDQHLESYPPDHPLSHEATATKTVPPRAEPAQSREQPAARCPACSGLIPGASAVVKRCVVPQCGAVYHQGCCAGYPPPQARTFVCPPDMGCQKISRQRRQQPGGPRSSPAAPPAKRRRVGVGNGPLEPPKGPVAAVGGQSSSDDDDESASSPDDDDDDSGDSSRSSQRL